MGCKIFGIEPEDDHVALNRKTLVKVPAESTGEDFSVLSLRFINHFFLYCVHTLYLSDEVKNFLSPLNREDLTGCWILDQELLIKTSSISRYFAGIQKLVSSINLIIIISTTYSLFTSNSSVTTCVL